MSLCSFLRPVTLHWLFRRDGKKENQLMQNIYFCNLIEFNISSLRVARMSLSTCCYRQLKTFLFRTEGKVLDVWNSFPSSSADLSLISVYRSVKWQVLIIYFSGVLQDFINIFKGFEMLGWSVWSSENEKIYRAQMCFFVDVWCCDCSVWLRLSNILPDLCAGTHSNSNAHSV